MKKERTGCTAGVLEQQIPVFPSQSLQVTSESHSLVMLVKLAKTRLLLPDNIFSGLQQHKLCLKAWLSCWLDLLIKWYDQSGTDRFRPAQIYTGSVLVLTWTFELQCIFIQSLADWHQLSHLMTKRIPAEVATPHYFSSFFKLFRKLHSHANYIYLKIFHTLKQVRSIQGCQMVELQWRYSIKKVLY